MTLRCLRVSAAAIVLGAVGCSHFDSSARALDRGNKHLEKRDYARAMLEYKNAIQAKPQDAEAHYRMALACLGAADARSGIMFLRKAVELDPKHEGAQLKLAELMTLGTSGKFLGEAEQKIRNVLATSTESVEGLRLLAITEWRLGKTADAEAHLQEVLRKFPDNVQSVVALAWMRISQKRMDEAEQLLKDAVVRTGDTPMAKIALGRFYALSGRWEEARREFQAVCDKDPGNDTALLDLSRTQFELKDLDAAGRSLAKLSGIPGSQYKSAYPVFLFRTGRTQEAIQQLRKLTESDPKDRTLRGLLVSALVETGRRPEAESLLKQSLEANPRDAEARLQRARIRLLDRRWFAAQADVSYVLQHEPESAQAHYLLSKVHAMRGEVHLERQELSAAVKRDPTLLPARIDLARSLVAAHDATGALQMIESAPASQANLLPVVLQRNWALIAAGKLSAARGAVDAVLKSAQMPEPVLQDAVLKILSRDLKAATASLEAALAKWPDDPRLVEVLAKTYVIERRTPQALDLIRSTAAKHPKSIPIQALAGRWLFDNGDLSGARRAYMAVREVDPDPVPSELMLAQIDVAEQKMADAQTRLSGLTTAVTVTSEVYFQLGSIEASLGKRDAAIQSFRKAIELDPQHIWALNNAAYLLVDHAKSADEALRFAQQAKERLPDNPVIADTLGWIYYHKGVYHTAVQHLEQAVKQGADPSAQYHLAMAYAKAGKRVQAQQTLQTALRVAPNLPEASAAKSLLAANP